MPEQLEMGVERAIALVLRYGALISTLVMAAGIGLGLFKGFPSLVYGRLSARPSFILPRLIRLDPITIVEVGVLLLLTTPIARIVVAVVGFALQRDLKYVLISLGVLAVVLLSISFAIEA